MPDEHEQNEVQLAIGSARRILREFADNSYGENKALKERKLWKAAADVEYAAFVTSIRFGLGDFVANQEPQKVEGQSDQMPGVAEELLERAENQIVGDPKSAYMSLRSATRCIQEMRKSMFP